MSNPQSNILTSKFLPENREVRSEQKTVFFKRLFRKGLSVSKIVQQQNARAKSEMQFNGVNKHLRNDIGMTHGQHIAAQLVALTIANNINVE